MLGRGRFAAMFWRVIFQNMAQVLVYETDEEDDVGARVAPAPRRVFASAALPHAAPSLAAVTPHRTAFPRAESDANSPRGAARTAPNPAPPPVSPLGRRVLMPVSPSQRPNAAAWSRSKDAPSRAASAKPNEPSRGRELDAGGDGEGDEIVLLTPPEKQAGHPRQVHREKTQR